MRYVKIILLVLLPSLLFSCIGDRTRVQPTQTYGLIDANLNGYTWSASQGGASYQNFSLTLYGTAPDGSYLEIVVYPYNGLGSYQANSPAKIVFYDANGYQFDATTGNVSITSDGPDLVQGNFYFTAFSSSLSIDMNGSFNLYYQ